MVSSSRWYEAGSDRFVEKFMLFLHEEFGRAAPGETDAGNGWNAKFVPRASFLIAGQRLRQSYERVSGQ
jgi:hypothetical protein